MPNRSPSSCRVTVPSACCWRKRQTLSIVFLLESASRDRQRRQARKPARSASSGREKNWTRSRRGRRDGHEGRQYTPVEVTAKTNVPSRLASRASTACQRGSWSRVFIRGVKIVLLMVRRYDWMVFPTIRFLLSKYFSHPVLLKLQPRFSVEPNTCGS